MRIERPRPTVFRVTLHAYELSALVAAARWVAEGAEGDLPDEAKENLRRVLKNYDKEIQGPRSSNSSGDEVTTNDTSRNGHD